MSTTSSRVVQELEAVAFGPGSDANGAEIKMASKLKALELLGKHLGLFESGRGKESQPVTIIEDI